MVVRLLSFLILTSMLTENIQLYLNSDLLQKNNKQTVKYENKIYMLMQQFYLAAT